MTDQKTAAGDRLVVAALWEVGRLAHMVECAVAARLPSPVTVAQYAVLRTIVSTEELSITQLAEMHEVSQPTMSSTVAKLRERGLVVTRTKPGDRRARFVSPTPEGRDIKRECDAASSPLLNDIAAQATGEDWRQICQSVTSLNRYLSDTLSASDT